MHMHTLTQQSVSILADLCVVTIKHDCVLFLGGVRQKAFFQKGATCTVL